MKISEAINLLNNHEEISTLYRKFDWLSIKLKYNDKVIKTYFQRLVTLRQLQPVEIQDIKFLSYGQRFVYTPTEISLHNVNMAHVHQTRNGTFVTYSNGYQLNRMQTDLPVGRYILVGKLLYHFDENPGETLWYNQNVFTNLGVIADFELKQTEYYKFYQVNHTKVDANHVFNKKWFVHVQGVSQTRPLIISECENFNDGKYTISQPLMRV